MRVQLTGVCTAKSKREEGSLSSTLQLSPTAGAVSGAPWPLASLAYQGRMLASGCVCLQVEGRRVVLGRAGFVIASSEGPVLSPSG